MNAGGLFWEGPLKLWASHHYYHLLHYIRARIDAKFPMEGIKYIHDGPAHGLDAVEMQSPYNGSSGMLATWAGLKRGYPSIVLVGVELSDNAYGHFRLAWQEFATTEEAKRVKSVAGWTAYLLGRPN